MPLRNLWGLLDDDATVIEEELDDERNDSAVAADEPAESDRTAIVEDLEHRLGELETDVESTNAHVESVRNSQEDVVDRIDELEDSIRRLLGIYERVTADENPFVEPDRGMGDEQFRFGVVGTDTLDEDADEDADGDADEERTGVVTFEDLRSETPNGSEGADRDGDSIDRLLDRDAARAPETGEAVSTNGAEAVSTNGAEGKSEARDGPGGEPPSARDWRLEDGDTDAEALPLTLADKYATDVLVFEWLSNLVTAAGPAGSVKAISYYSEIGWISDEAEEYLLDVLSGPYLDAMVDPNEPGHLSASDHAESYAYIRKLAAVQAMNGME